VTGNRSCKIKSKEAFFRLRTPQDGSYEEAKPIDLLRYAAGHSGAFASVVTGTKNSRYSSGKTAGQDSPIPQGNEMQKRRATFTGEIDPISENLKHLLGQLYLHRFTIMHMKINRDISSTTTKLIVVSDATTGDVVSYLWQGGYDVPESFKQLLAHYPKDVGLRNSDVLSTAFVRLNALANLIVYPDRASDTGYRIGIGGRVGVLSAKQKGRVMELSAELIRSLGPSSLLTLQIEETDEPDRGRYMYEGHKYGRLAIVEPEDRRRRSGDGGQMSEVRDQR